MPSSDYDREEYSRNKRQKESWEKDERVKVVHRPLKYYRDQGSDNQLKQEKGIDVLCALAVIRNVYEKEANLIILASHDSDLAPAIEEAEKIADGTKLETASWFRQIPKYFSKINPKTKNTIWNTRLGQVSFDACFERLA